MAVEVESTSQLEEFVRVLKRRIWWILVPFSIIATLGTSFAVLVPKKYVAKTRILVREVRNRSGQIVSGSEGQARVAKHLIRSPNRVRSVVQELGWRFDELTRVEQDILIEKIIDNLSVETPAMGGDVAEQIVEIKYGDTDPERALGFTEEVSRRWREEVLEANKNAKRRAFTNLNDRNLSIEKRMVAIAEEISGLMELHQIAPWKPDYRNTERPLPPEFERLFEATTEYGRLQEEIEDDALTLAHLEGRYQRESDSEPVVQETQGSELDKEIRKRRDQILELRSQIEDKGWRPTHSKYETAQSKIRSLESEIAALERSSTGTTVTETWRENPKKIALGEEIETLSLALERKRQKLVALGEERENLVAKTAELQSVYQNLEALEDERDRLNEQLTDFGLDLQDMRIELDLTETTAGDPFVIVDPVERPTRPTEPDPVLITVFSILLGAGLGLGLAMLLEYTKSCFRSVGDVTRVMSAPVLGVVGAIVTSSQRRRRLVASRLLAGSTITFVLLVGYVTWAWAYRHDMLSDGLLESIESFRKSFE